MARVTSGHSAFDQAGDRFTSKTGYSQIAGTQPWVKDRCRMGRSNAPDPKLTIPHAPQSGLSYPPSTRLDAQMLRSHHERLETKLVQGHLSVLR